MPDVRNNLLFGNDNTYDIGANAAARPRDLFLGRNLVVAGALTVAGSPVGTSTAVREEFTPTNAATTVTLANSPSAVLIVARNGLVQSATLGHYSIAGAVITFTTAFGTGEQVIVVYGAVQTVGADRELRAYIQQIMAVLDPGGAPPPPP